MNKEIEDFIKSQKSVWLYPKVRQALKEVLSAMPKKDFIIATKNLYLMVLHEGAYGQVMHFPQPEGNFKILQLSVAKKVSMKKLRWIIAHEFGHVMQDRNWRKSDGRRLERDADKRAKTWGFKKVKL